MRPSRKGRRLRLPRPRLLPNRVHCSPGSSPPLPLRSGPRASARLQLRPIYHQLEERIEAHIFVAFIAYCLHVTLRARLKPLAPGLTPRAVLDKLGAIQMLDVHFPTTDGRTLILSRYTELNVEQKLLVNQLKLDLPSRPPPASPRRRGSRRAPRPSSCSGDLCGATVASVHFFPSVGKVGLRVLIFVMLFGYQAADAATMPVASLTTAAQPPSHSRRRIDLRAWSSPPREAFRRQKGEYA